MCAGLKEDAAAARASPLDPNHISGWFAHALDDDGRDEMLGKARTGSERQAPVGSRILHALDDDGWDEMLGKARTGGEGPAPVGSRISDEMAVRTRHTSGGNFKRYSGTHTRVRACDLDTVPYEL